MIFEIRSDRHGGFYGRFTYGDGGSGKTIEFLPGNVDLKSLLLLIAFFANYIREVL